MKNFRKWFWLLVLIVAIPVIGEASIQQQRDQIGVTIIINVTPNPLGYKAPASQPGAIVAQASLHGATPQLQRAFRAESLHFSPAVTQVAQVQRGVKVEASVAPNPLATLLYSDQSAVIVNAVAGTSTFVSCAYHVTVDSTVTLWTLKHGLTNDFAGSFPGGDVANNTYLSSPQPTATPFIVYNDNGGVWANAASNGGMKTYCVDLTVTVPGTTSQGTYSSDAVYTLFY